MIREGQGERVRRFPAPAGGGRPAPAGAAAPRDGAGRAIRVVLIDGHAVVRAGMRLLLAARPEIEVVGEAGGCDDGAAVVRARTPDLAIVSLDQFDDSELERLAAAAPPGGRVAVLAVSRSEETESVLRAARAGALGIVGQDEPVDVLVAAIASVHASEAWYRRRSVATILKAFLIANPAPSLDPETARLSALTRREREVVALLSEGLKNREIAERLFISEVTVRHHLTSVFEKLGIANRFELLRIARRADVGL